METEPSRQSWPRLAVVLLIPLVIGSDCISGAAVTPAIAGLTAREVLDEARTTATGLLYDAQNTADNSVNNAANQLLFATTQTVHVVGGDLDRKVNRLDHDVALLVDSVHLASRRVSEGTTTLTTLEDEVQLDLEAALNRLPGYLGGGDRYLFTRVQGIQLLPKSAGNYTVQVRGTNFGFDQQRRAARVVSFRIGDVDLTEQITQRAVGEHVRSISFSAEALQPLFQADRLNVVDAHVEMAVYEVRDGTPRTDRDPKATIATTFGMYLYSNNAGSLRVLGNEQEWGWVPGGEWSFTWNAPSNHCSSDCDDPDSFPLGGPWRGVSTTAQMPNYYSSGTPREGQCRPTGATRYEVVGSGHMHRGVSTSVSGPTLRIALETNSHSVQFQVYATKECWGRSGVRPDVEYFDGRIDFNQTYTFDVPATASALRAEALGSWGGDPVRVALPTTGPIGELIQVRSTNDGTVTHYVVEVQPPARLSQ